MLYQSEPSDEILNCETEGIIGTVAGVIGNIQANEVIKKILNLKTNNRGKIFIFNLENLSLRKVDFFKDGWNIFDSVIVVSSLIPTAGTSVMVLRLLRLARLLRVISFIPELRFVIEALIESLKKSVYVLILIFILLYIYAVAGVILFETIEGGRFEELGEALLSLVQIMTLSSWESLMLPITDVYPYAWMYFVSFVIFSSIIVLNLFVAILVDVVAERRKRLEKEEAENLS